MINRVVFTKNDKFFGAIIDVIEFPTPSKLFQQLKIDFGPLRVREISAQVISLYVNKVSSH